VTKALPKKPIFCELSASLKIEVIGRQLCHLIFQWTIHCRIKRILVPVLKSVYKPSIYSPVLTFPFEAFLDFIQRSTFVHPLGVSITMSSQYPRRIPESHRLYKHEDNYDYAEHNSITIWCFGHINHIACDRCCADDSLLDSANGYPECVSMPEVLGGQCANCVDAQGDNCNALSQSELTVIHRDVQ
jgi:hypothetical protein